MARAADPEHGRTFLLDLGVRGRPEPRVVLGMPDGVVRPSDADDRTDALRDRGGGSRCFA
jgi:hypothetical protein